MKAAYDLVFKRTSTFAAAIVFSAFIFERTFDIGADYIFDTYNKGVTNHNLLKLYKMF